MTSKTSPSFRPNPLGPVRGASLSAPMQAAPPPLADEPNVQGAGKAPDPDWDAKEEDDDSSDDEPATATAAGSETESRFVAAPAHDGSWVNPCCGRRLRGEE